jgi:cell wall-associated NlpC family hydrolase
MDGFDCYGLVQEMYRRYGISITDYTADFDDLEKVNELITSKTAISSNWRRIEPDEELPVPCLLAIRFGTPSGIINHTGCYIGNGRFIHIRANIGVCVDRIDSPAWRHVIEGLFEYVGDSLD